MPKAYKDRDHTASKQAKHNRMDSERNNAQIRVAEHRELVSTTRKKGKGRGKAKSTEQE